MNKKILGLALAATFAAGSAQAIVITDSYSNPMQTTEIGQTGSLDKFDTSLGTLNSAVLTFTGNSLSEALLTNTADNKQTFKFNSDLEFYFDLSEVGLTAPSPAFVTNLVTTGGPVTLASGESLALGPNSAAGLYTTTVTGADLLAFMGTGTFNTSCETLSSSTFNGGGGNIDNIQTTTANCAGEIAYDYTENDIPPEEVPEPASIALLGLGLVAIGAVRRRKQAK